MLKRIWLRTLLAMIIASILLALAYSLGFLT